MNPDPNPEPVSEGKRCPTCGSDDSGELFAMLDRGRAFDAGISGCPDDFHSPPAVTEVQRSPKECDSILIGGVERSPGERVEEAEAGFDARYQGPFDGDELIRWAESYGHPEEWAKKAQAAHARAEKAEEVCAALQQERDELERVNGLLESSLANYRAVVLPAWNDHNSPTAIEGGMGGADVPDPDERIAELLAAEQQTTTLLSERDELRSALDRLLFIAINGVVCDPHDNPCKDCKEAFEAARKALDQAPSELGEET